MADTRRSLSSLQTLLADNSSGDISAQDARDELISSHPEKVSQGGAYASLPGSDRLTGDLYFPTDGVHLHRYDGSAWKAFGPSYPLTPVPSSGWSWLNQGSSTVSEAGGRVQLYAVNNSGGNGVRGRYRTAPSAPWTATFLFAFCPSFLDDGSAGNGIADCGVFFRESSSGKLVTHMLQIGSNPINKYVSYLWDSATAINTTYRDRNCPLSPWAFVWMQLFDDNTNKGVKVSPDGYDWTLVPHSHGRTTGMTPDQYGFGCNTYSMKLSMAVLSLKEG